MLDKERAVESLLVGMAAVGALFLVLILANLLSWPVCAVCGKRHAALLTWTIETAPGREAGVCTDCAHRIVAERLAE
jgi:DNA-directed RNA polymerase subunit RPC12/RpoP